MIPENLPIEVPFSEVEMFDDLDTRVSAIDCLFVNIIGVNDDLIEFCPNETPTSQEEYLAWVWVVKPSLGSEILSKDCVELNDLIKHYQTNQMDKWFEYIAT
ncbi:MAG: hypothetical protein ACTH4U_03360 [Pseudoalteromonas prydzensis]|uniref:hypothetical protein n=1 Tax=Pseudoalteromonas prydzensis TaxID=182141 RepID=UPI003F96CA69